MDTVTRNHSESLLCVFGSREKDWTSSTFMYDREKIGSSLYSIANKNFLVLRLKTWTDPERTKPPPRMDVYPGSLILFMFSTFSNIGMDWGSGLVSVSRYLIRKVLRPLYFLSYLPEVSLPNLNWNRLLDDHGTTPSHGV